VLQDYIHAVENAEARRDRLTRQIEEVLPSWSMAPVVAALQAMRGVALVVAVTVVAEVGTSAGSPTLASQWPISARCPASIHPGIQSVAAASPKPGNTLARRVLIESAWT